MPHRSQPYYVWCETHGFMPMSCSEHARLVKEHHYLDGCNVERGHRDQLDTDPGKIDPEQAVKEALS